MLENIIIHIGMYHTGTTAMQDILCANPPELADQGIFFCMPVSLTYALHSEVSPKLPAKYRLRAEDVFNELMQEAKARHARTLVLSHEGITYNPYYRSFTFNLKEDHETRRANAAHIRQRLFELCRGCNVRIVFYPRRQDHWINSNYCNAVYKNFMPGVTHALIEELAHDCLCYHTLMEQWATLFGRGSISIRPYEKVRMPHGTLFDFCCHVLHCDTPRNCAHTANVTPGRETIAFCRALLPYFEKKTLLPILERCTSQEGGAGGLLDFRRRLAILERFEEENRLLARDFLGTEEPLFLEPLPDAARYPVPDKESGDISPRRLAQMLACADMELRRQGWEVEMPLLFQALEIPSDAGAPMTKIPEMLHPDDGAACAVPDLIVRVPPGNMPERLYALRMLLCVFLGLHARVEVSPGTAYELRTPEGRCVLRMKDVLFAGRPEGRWLCTDALPGSTRWLTHDGLAGPAPVFYGSPCLSYEDGMWRCGADIPGMIFFMLSRFEELLCAERDNYLRIPAAASLAHRHGFLELPVVNQWTRLVALLLAARGVECRERGGFALLPTHDLDRFEEDDSLLWLAGMEQRLGIRAVFNLAGASDLTVDGEYALASKERLTQVRALRHDFGHRFGFHPGVDTWINRRAWRIQYDSLRDPGKDSLREGRQHYLRYSLPFTLRIWEENGMRLDTGLGYADAFGFRCGTGDAFPVFDVLARRTLRVWEQPFVMMDATRNYRGMSDEELFAKGDALATAAKTFGTPMTILFHNTFFCRRYPNPKLRRLLYKRFLLQWR